MQRGARVTSLDRRVGEEAPTSLDLLAAALDRALDDEELTLAYQCKFSLTTNRIVGFEGLIRWVIPNGDTVLPIDFIPVAEASGQIVRIGEWVLESACSQLATWQHDYPDSALTMAVNVSPRQFGPRLVTAVQSTLDRTGVAASDVWLEVTETTVMSDVDTAVVMLDRLRGLGVKISLDDFGTGQSSLARLRRLPIDELKVDRAFVHGLGVNRVDTAIVESVISLAHAMGCTATAEGVENASQLDRLRDLGCDCAQGYLLARPVSPRDITEHLAAEAAGRPFAASDHIAHLDVVARRRGNRSIEPAADELVIRHAPPAVQSRQISEREPTVPVDSDFSERQLEIIERLLRGERVPTIARELYVSQSTVRNHLSVIFRKLGVHSQEELLQALRRRSLSA